MTSDVLLHELELQLFEKVKINHHQFATILFGVHWVYFGTLHKRYFNLKALYYCQYLEQLVKVIFMKPHLLAIRKTNIPNEFIVMDLSYLSFT